MKRLFDNHIFSDRLRYEAHRLTYLSDSDTQVELSGILAAAVLYALLVNTDEGDARGVTISTQDYRDRFFTRYEDELIGDNGGLFTTEVHALSQSYIELSDDSENILMHLCRNERLLDLAYGLTIEYMQQLVGEQVGGAIYDAIPFHEPFAQWLYNAAFIETRRQRLLAVNWADPADVYALDEELSEPTSDDPEKPTFYFEGVSAEHILEAYFRWMWTAVQTQTAVLPDAQQQLAKMQPEIIRQETNWDFLRPELGKCTPADRRLFNDWMTRWKDHITRKLGNTPDQTFPDQSSRHKVEQVLFPDNITPCPPENSYVAVCDYIHERCLYDDPFRTYYTTRPRKDFCEQLTLMFGWYVDPNPLGKRINYRKNHKK